MKIKNMFPKKKDRILVESDFKAAELKVKLPFIPNRLFELRIQEHEHICMQSWNWQTVYLFPLGKKGKRFLQDKCPGKMYRFDDLLVVCPHIMRELEKLK